MDDVKVVSVERYAEIVAMLDKANKLAKRSLNPRLTLAQKVELQRKAKELRQSAKV